MTPASASMVPSDPMAFIVPEFSMGSTAPEVSMALATVAAVKT